MDRSYPAAAGGMHRREPGHTATVLSYVLPLRARAACPDLTGYLRWLAPRADVVVVDGSGPGVFACHHEWWGEIVRHVPVHPGRRSPMGKVGGVLTGMDLARERLVVIADDDVRYDDVTLERMEALLARAEVVRPQNVFSDWPWHARWDTGRTLLARVTGGDWPGTLGVHRDVVRGAGGYAGDVMFENLELVRTVRAAGGRELVAYDLYVRREPPTARHFWGQRVRQAYDELARPTRLAAQLAVLPALVVGGRRAGVALALGAVAAAEAGRRRARGAAAFPATTSLFAPLWLGERAVTSWLAVASRLRYGGVRYGGTVLRASATPARRLAPRHAAPGPDR
jgi:hypothetical protein